MRERPTRLEVYVGTRCASSHEARRLARSAARHFPHIAVCLVEVDQWPEPEALPEQLVAVPTYVLDGEVVSLGNPSPALLFDRLKKVEAS